MNLTKYLKNSGIQILLFTAIGVTLLSITIQQVASNNSQKNGEILYQTYRILNQNNLDLLILEAETNRANYLLTGDDAYNEKCKATVSKIVTTISNLNQLIGDNKNQELRLKNIQALVTKNFSNYSQKSEFQSEDTLSVKEILTILTSAKNTDSNLIKAELEEFFNEETRVQKEQDANLRKGSKISSMLLWLSGIFTVIILWVGVRTINKQKRLRREMFKKLEQQNKALLFNDGPQDEEVEEQRIIEDLISNLKNATGFIKDVGNRNYNIQYPGIDEKNILLNKENLAGALIDMRDQMKEVAIEEKSRSWATEGLALFSDILRDKNEDVTELSYNIISNIVKYIKANQGGIFLINDSDKSDPFLELTGCFAYDRKKYLDKKINIGEGLIGQAYLERDYIYLTNIPNDYVNITSGLGSANPKSLLISPLIVNDTVLGVLEIASFHEFKPYEIDFIKKISESIASTILSVRINENTKKLLEASQEQAEEMRAQEEEMRQNMEELQATQEEINRKNVDIQNRMEAIDNSGIASVEFDMKGNILTANKAFLALFEYSLEEIRGSNHVLFIEPGADQTDEYKELWNDLSKGISSHGEYKRVTKSGREVYIQGAYSVIMGKNSKPERVLNLSSDITETKNLLIEVQEQTEELRAQEEEMRQNMEELQTTQEELTKQMIEVQCRMEGINNSGVASIELDLKGYIINANAAFLNLLDYQLEDLAGKKYDLLLNKEYAESDEYRNIWNKLQEGKSHTGEFEYYSKTGNQIYVMGSFSAILDQHNNPQKIINLAIDITESRNLLSAIQEQTEQLKAQEEFVKENFFDLQNSQEELMKQNKLLQNRVDAILNSNVLSVEFDLEGKILYVNKSFLNVVGYLESEMIGKSYEEFLHPKELASKSFKELIKKLKKGQICIEDFLHLSKSGQEILIKGSYSAISDPQGQPKSILSVAAHILATQDAKELK